MRRGQPTAWWLVSAVCVLGPKNASKCGKKNRLEGRPLQNQLHDGSRARVTNNGCGGRGLVPGKRGWNRRSTATGRGPSRQRPRQTFFAARGNRSPERRRDRTAWKETARRTRFLARPVPSLA